MCASLVLLGLMAGCPCKDDDCGPLEFDLIVYLQNQSNDTLFYHIISRSPITDISDTLIEDMSVERLYNNLEAGNRRELPPGGTDSVYRASSEWLNRATHGRYYYIIHNDTLAEIPIEEFDQVRGVKKYFLKTREDYEAINFTLVWP